MSRKEVEQDTLFEVEPAWVDQWVGMPEFSQEDLEPFQAIKVNFECRADRDAFAKLIEQPISDRTRSVWYPKAELVPFMNKRYANEKQILPKYPIYVISKGRAQTRLTSKALEYMGVPYSIVIEQQEYDEYAEVIDKEKILVLPFSNLGQGSIPARNWVMEHSIATGAKRHWILDDNIRGFYRRNNNRKIQVSSGATFRACEDFTDRYENVAISGMNYFMFAPNRSIIPPFQLNTRIYSCILLNNEIEHRWRGRYNEDTDLSIRVLKDGWCTILFNAFLAEKQTTMKMKGGNTEELYQDDGRLQMAESLKEQHPELVKITWKWGRWQHSVDYSPFRKNRLKPRNDLQSVSDVDNYGMSLVYIEKDEEGVETITGPAEACSGYEDTVDG